MRRRLVEFEVTGARLPHDVDPDSQPRMAPDGNLRSRAQSSIARLKSVWRPAANDPGLREWLGDRPLVVLEAGARGGPNSRWSPFGDAVEIVGIEADPEEHARLERELGGPARRFLNYALASEHGRGVLHVCRQAGCSSLFPPNREFVAAFAPEFQQMMEEVATETVETTPLDAVAEAHRLAPDVICLDVQGAELAVLQGARQTLERVKLVECEVELAPQYVGQPLFAEVDQHLRARGFALLGLRRTYWRRQSERSSAASTAGGQLVHGDALYYNRELLEHAPGDERELVRWLVALAAYRQDDFVAHLLERHPARTALAIAPARLRRVVLPGDKLGWRLARRALTLLHAPHHLTLRHWVVGLRSAPAPDWHDPDFF